MQTSESFQSPAGTLWAGIHTFPLPPGVCYLINCRQLCKINWQSLIHCQRAMMTRQRGGWFNNLGSNNGRISRCCITALFIVHLWQRRAAERQPGLFGVTLSAAVTEVFLYKVRAFYYDLHHPCSMTKRFQCISISVGWHYTSLCGFQSNLTTTAAQWNWKIKRTSQGGEAETNVKVEQSSSESLRTEGEWLNLKLWLLLTKCFLLLQMFCVI